jgi:LPXTG-site transpeptidase (sortase) family protein
VPEQTPETPETPEETPEQAPEQTSEQTTGPDNDPRPKPGRTRRRVAAVIGVFGELMITGGVVLGLFVVYSLWWTNVVANQEASRDSDAVREVWEASPDDGNDATPGREFDPDDGIGFLHVPAMTGDDILVKEGIGTDILDGGVAGYYDEPVESAMPWDEEGNFSLAAHRDGHGARFHDIHHIEEGDPIVFESRNNWYVYRTFAILPETSRYNTSVLAPIPEDSGRTEPGRYITLTTCTPILTSQERYVVWGELERVEPVDGQRSLPPELR